MSRRKGRNRKRLFKDRYFSKGLIERKKTKIEVYQIGLIKNATLPERLLFNALVRENVDFDFQRLQKRKKYRYFIDFVVFHNNGTKYGIEIDGKSHNGELAKFKDEKRTKRILSCDAYREILRFKNEEVLKNIDDVVKTIKLKTNPRPFLGRCILRKLSSKDFKAVNSIFNFEKDGKVTFKINKPNITSTIKNYMDLLPYRDFLNETFMGMSVF